MRGSWVFILSSFKINYKSFCAEIVAVKYFFFSLYASSLHISVVVDCLSSVMVTFLLQAVRFQWLFFDLQVVKDRLLDLLSREEEEESHAEDVVRTSCPLISWELSPSIKNGFQIKCKIVYNAWMTRRETKMFRSERWWVQKTFIF